MRHLKLNSDVRGEISKKITYLCLAQALLAERWEQGWVGSSASSSGQAGGTQHVILGGKGESGLLGSLAEEKFKGVEDIR